MALFKKRSSDSSPSSAASAPESAAAYTDPLHRRARHRLIGASVLVVIAVLVLPWVFDVKPPTVSSNVPIAIDGQNSDSTTVSAATATLPLAPAPTAPAAPAEEIKAPSPTPAPERAAKPAAAANTETARTESPAAREPANIDELIAQRQKQDKPEQQKQPERPKPTPAKPTPPAPPAKPAPAATPTAAKPDQATPPVQYNFPEKGRFVVQIGAYVEADKVANVRKRLSQAGLNNYTQQVTIDGKKVTRVRLGPFNSRKQMEQVANKVRALGLPVSLYQL